MAAGNTERNMYKLKKELGGDGSGDDDGNDKTLSEKIGYAVQAHHCISCSVMNDSKFRSVQKKALAAGYDINGGNNGVALPAYFGHMRKQFKQRHRGGHHDIYYDVVRKELRDLIDEFEDLDPCDDEEKKEILAALAGVENRIRAGLKNRSVWLYDWSKDLYAADYRDEGTGAMNRPGKREGSYSAGQQWKKDTAGTIKRRHEIQKDRNNKERKVLLRKWYAQYGYPIPGRLT